MAHEFESGCFAVTPAWHGLGTVFATPPTVDAAFLESRLDYEVLKRPAVRRLADGNVVEIPGRFELYRDRDEAFYAHCGSDFEPYQNADMREFVRPMIESGEATIESMLSLRGGRRVVMLAAVRGAVGDVVKGDTVKHYVLIANGHDGSLAITCGFTSIRVVCANTLAMSLNNRASKLLKTRHTRRAVANLEKIREAFDLARGELQSQASVFQYLASKKCDDDTMVKYAREVLSPGSSENPDQIVRNLQKPLDKFAGEGAGSDLPGVRGTMWGAFNAVTDYLTHDRGRNADTRVESNWFGASAAMTSRALDVAVEYADNAPAAELARECSRNTALASASFSELLGGSVKPADDGSEFARLLNS